ncbi:uncharacterized protein CBL_01549 [Carabus blaptoides fortunei]
MKVFLFIYIVSVVLVTSVTGRVTVNTCKHNFDYDTKHNNKNCWYNPDVDLSVPDVITRHKYPLEVYNVTTQDGYILQVFRIPRGKYNVNTTIKSRQPIFLQHGIFVSCSVYVINGNESIAFMLADNGYDVWLGNSRGSAYGKGHIKFSLNDDKYWNFSYHEMGIYDLPNTLDLVNNITGRNDVIYVGQSMGTNLPYVYAADFPEHAKQRMKLIVNLAPTVFLVGLRTPSIIVTPFWQLILSLSRKLRVNELLPKSTALKSFSSAICLKSGYKVVLCETLLFLLFGFDYEYFKPELLPMLLGHIPAGSSLKTLVHLAQGVVTKEFAHYDHGTYLNMEYYNSTNPPIYNLSRLPRPYFVVVIRLVSEPVPLAVPVPRPAGVTIPGPIS